MSEYKKNCGACGAGPDHGCDESYCYHNSMRKSSAPAGYKSQAVRMAKAIQRFRNLDMLRDLVELRGSQEYHDLCLAWKEFDDATDKQHRADL